MSDLTIIYSQQCTNDKFFGKINGYDVGLEINSGYESCSCPDYKFRKKKSGKLCKHLIEAYNRICGWHKEYSKEIQTKEQEKNMICQKCGSKTMIIKIGV